MHALVRILIVGSIGKQRDYEAEGIDLGTEARQAHLFFSQHFKYVFHSRLAPAHGQ
jgi:hypothetical protein